MRRVDTIQNRLIQAMKEAGMRQVDLCEKTGIPSSTMCQYIKGTRKPKDCWIYELAKALGVTEAWLMGFEDDDSYLSNLLTRIDKEDTARVIGYVEALLSSEKYNKKEGVG